jgi:hypothetical protein
MYRAEVRGKCQNGLNERRKRMASKVTLLEKMNGTWSEAEVSALVRVSVEIERLRAKPGRLAAMNKPLSGCSFQDALGHADFTTREVDYRDRWV